MRSISSPPTEKAVIECLVKECIPLDEQFMIDGERSVSMNIHKVLKMSHYNVQASVTLRFFRR